ncbi:peptidoglycan-associated lipoprotein Pal [Marinicella meishanensis]|uniref:peptidoglycan-associated lipoprotein Pal n=1 Tax=Marinicella meishanensis TaxID=2873263 RepID=UPI001CBAC5C6|nr:peptidoglycan-associated lipoprotein Pal [Marinicella sp. NBU2979]
MNKITKIATLLIFALALTACKKDEVKPSNPDDGSSTDNTPVVDTNPVRTDGLICCNPADLTDPNSLLSKRVVYFDYDMATIRSEFREMLALHGQYLSENPSARMTLEGHADERGSREYNLALGEKRGNAVANLLRAGGASADQITVVSYGEERPEAMCSDESCWSQNRRAVIVYTAE